MNVFSKKFIVKNQSGGGTKSSKKTSACISASFDGRVDIL